MRITSAAEFTMTPLTDSQSAFGVLLVCKTKERLFAYCCMSNRLISNGCGVVVGMGFVTFMKMNVSLRRGKK